MQCRGVKGWRRGGEGKPDPGGWGGGMEIEEGESEVGRGQRNGGHTQKLYQPRLVISARCGLDVKPDSQCGSVEGEMEKRRTIPLSLAPSSSGEVLIEEPRRGK